MEFQYCPGVFLQGDERSARRIILTDEPGLTSEQRWERETAFLKPLIDALPAGMMIDLGCGIGRLSKVYLNSHPDSHVVGTDISPTMRAHAAEYVGDEANFFIMHPNMLGRFGAYATCAIAVWALQHIPDPYLELGRLWK